MNATNNQHFAFRAAENALRERRFALHTLYARRWGAIDRAPGLTPRAPFVVKLFLCLPF